MTRDDFTERAARHAARLFARIPLVSDLWDDRAEPYRQAMRADVFEVLDESGYPAALDEAAELLQHLVQSTHRGCSIGDDPAHTHCVVCGRVWPCPTERARTWLADNDEQAP